MSDLVTFAHALSDTTRWRIVRLVMDHAMCICELADILDMPQSSISSHVQILRKTGLLESERCGKWSYFRIDGRYLKVVRDLEQFFEGSGSKIWKDDDSCAVKRLAQRAESCCPGPQKLTPRHRKREHAKP